jgi:hypothetical protein
MEYQSSDRLIVWFQAKQDLEAFQQGFRVNQKNEQI